MNFFSKYYYYASLGVIIVFAVFPLFFNLPFRDNIYLSWEGAYRMYKGQMPFRDFGLPMGYGYWLPLTAGFYLFGPYLHSLVKIQVLINIVSGVSFLEIIRRFQNDKGIIFLSTFVYVISYSFFNFWPWYNHMVIVYEFIGLALLMPILLSGEFKLDWRRISLLVGSAFVIFLSIFTKQDGGAFAGFVAGILLIYYTAITRKFAPILIFVGAYIITALLFILPLIPHEFGYWFNYGQPPHNSRVNAVDLLGVIFGQSNFIKLYLVFIGIIIVNKSQSGFKWLLDKSDGLHLLLTLGILFQASILQVTSYVPADGNLYFHSFMIFYILTNLNFKFDFSKIKNLVPLALLLFLWWSGVYWKYTSRIFSKFISNPKSEMKSSLSAN